MADGGTPSRSSRRFEVAFREQSAVVVPSRPESDHRRHIPVADVGPSAGRSPARPRIALLVKAPPIATVALAVLVLLYAATAGTMAVRRHRNLESQALDMGYAD